MDEGNAIDLVKRKIKEGKNITLLSGSGISSESGIPTFRGKEGLWKKYRAEELASPRAFQKNPNLVWDWYNWRREIIREKKPNPAHYACFELEKKMKTNFNIITQNVDGLHQKAGCKNVIEIHGNIWRTRCTNCFDVKSNYEILDNNPRCKLCSNLLRPDIVWFGESLDENILYNAFQILFKSDILLVVGTSGVIYPAAQFAGTAKDNGAFVVEINPDETPQSDIVNVSIRGKAGNILPILIK